MKIKKSFLIGSLLLLELFLPLYVIWRLNMRADSLYGTMEAVGVVVVILLALGRNNPSYKLTWSIIILCFPLFGVFIYLIAGTNYFSPKLKKTLENSRAVNCQLLRQKPRTLDRLRMEGGECIRQSQFIQHLSDMPVCLGTQAELLIPGEKMYDSMLRELKRAEKFIFIEVFIIAPGEMWDDIFDVLKERAAAGVEVRIIFDGIGSIDRLPGNFKKICAQAGIQAENFNPFLPLLNKFMDYRDHRKIVVIDGNVGYTGGANIGDEYINRIERFGHWYDGGICLRGEAVWNLTVMFFNMWIIAHGPDTTDYSRYAVTETAEDGGFIQPFSDSPFSGNVSEGTYIQMIGAACRYFYVTTPYLVIDHEMTEALCNAARGGVDVRIITPHIPDKKYVFAVTQSCYQQLIDYGVKIYEYTPGFIHTKMVLCDDHVGLVGTVNMDYRSFYQQFEDSVWLCNCGVLQEMKTEFIKLFNVSARIDPVLWEKRGLRQRVSETFFRMFAPLM